MNGLWLAVPFLAVRFLAAACAGARGAAARRALCAHAGRREDRLCGVSGRDAGDLHLPGVSDGAVGWRVDLSCGERVLCRGLGLCAAAMVAFCAPDGRGLNTNGVYRLSRHPMYVGYFVCFVGMALLVRSPVLLSVVLIFQVAAHWMVLAEERWCLETFGDDYARYIRSVRRYL